tara:strand:- start:12 stop:281 length:270 start_codon:yes stop_codon:yes gene_type:complete
MKLIKVITKANIRIEDKNEVYLQSNDSIVARYDKDRGYITIGYDWDYSKATIKAVKSFISDYSNYRYTGKTTEEKTVGYFTVADLRRQL